MKAPFLLPFLFFYFFTVASQAETKVGCLIDGGPGIIYLDAFSGSTKFYSNGNYRVYNRNGQKNFKVYNPPVNCLEYSPGELRLHSEVGFATSCWVNDIKNPDDNDSNVSYGSWVEFDVRTNCVASNLPIDDYIPLLLAIFAGLGFLFIRRQITLSYLT